MKFSLVAEEFREETLGSLAFREREKGSRVERIEGRGQLRINRRFRAKKSKASKSFSFWQAVAAQAEEG